MLETSTFSATTRLVNEAVLEKKLKRKGESS